jgi:hypothetical protein
LSFSISLNFKITILPLLINLLSLCVLYEITILAVANVNSRVLFLGFGLSFCFFSSFSSPSTETRTNWKKKKTQFLCPFLFHLQFLSCHLSNLKMQQSRFYLPTPPLKHCTTVYSAFSFSFFPFFWNFLSEIHSCFGDAEYQPHQSRLDFLPKISSMHSVKRKREKHRAV